MKKLLLLLLIVSSCTDQPKEINSDHKISTLDFTTVFEKSEGLETATYQETITYYQDLADSYPEISIQEIGETYSGNT